MSERNFHRFRSPSPLLKMISLPKVARNMRTLTAQQALGLVIAGCLAILAMALAVIFLPDLISIHIAALTIIGIAIFLITVGISSFRLQGAAWRALADHLGDELINMEAINTTITDQVCAFTADGIVYQTSGFAPLFDRPHLGKVDDLASALGEGFRDSFSEALHGLSDAGEQFTRTVTLPDNRLITVSGHRATVRKGQPDIFVLRARDVTLESEAGRREQKLREETARLMGFWKERLDLLPVPVWLRREDLSLAWVNRAAAAILESDNDSIIAQQRELFVGELGEDGRWLAEQAQLDMCPRQEMAHLIVKGERRSMTVSEVPLNQPDAAFIGMAVDMTRLEEKEKELKRHIAGNDAVLERLGAAIAIFGADQRLKFYNQAYVDLWAFEEAFLRSEPLFSEVLEELRVKRMIVEQADFSGYRREQQKLFTSLIEPVEELQHLPDDRMLRALVTPHPFGGLMFIYEDVSRRYELETSYNTLVAVQRETLNNLSEGICVYGSDGKLKLYNPAFVRIWNLDDTTLAGEPHASDVLERLRPFFNKTEEEWPGFHAEMVAIALDRNPRSGRLARADGSILDYLALPLPDGAVLHSFLDITDSVRIEQALRQSNDALEAADRLKSEFIANITYQLRTPLTAIMGFTEILQNQYFGPLNDRQKDYCDSILEAGNRLITLINDILELASIEAGYMNLERHDVEVAQMIQGVSDIVADWTRAEDLELEVTCEDDIGTAMLDERRIRQALFNLISNAIKFTPAGGRVRLAAEKQNELLVLTVSDNGIGISADDQTRIFKRFERANVRTGQAGAGLGLSVVKSIIEMHGGRVEIESAPSRGSTIRCYLPITAPVEATPAAIEAPSAS